eukprot:COSAG05_NODE_1439_length_4884_cov_11.725065_4_plen_280_part_00
MRVWVWGLAPAMSKIPKMKMKWGINASMTPTFVGRKKLYKGYRWYDHQNWLGRTSHALKSGVQRKHAAYDAVWRVPPMPVPLRPCFRDIGFNRARVPPAIVFPEDKVLARFNSDDEIQKLFADRLHPFGNSSERGGRVSKELPPFVPQTEQLQAALRHGPQLLPKLQRRFLAHHKMLVEDKGCTTDEAYGMVKEVLLEQYKQFEKRNSGVLKVSKDLDHVRMRDEYNQFQTMEEQAMYTSYQRRDMLLREEDLKGEREVVKYATTLSNQAAAERAQAER